MDLVRSILTSHKIMSSKELELEDIVIKDLFHSHPSVVISSLKTLEKMGDTSILEHSKNLFRSSKESIKLKVIDNMKASYHEEYKEFLLGILHSSESKAVVNRVILTLGAAGDDEEILQQLRNIAGFATSDLEKRKTGISALKLAKDFSFLSQLWKEYVVHDEDYDLLKHSLEAVAEYQDSELFQELYRKYREIGEPHTDKGELFVVAMFDTYAEDSSSQVLMNQLKERLVLKCRSISEAECNFVYNILINLKQVDKPFFVKCINAILISKHISKSGQILKKQAFLKLFEDIKDDEISIKGITSTYIKILYNYQALLQAKISARGPDRHRELKQDFVEFFDTLGNQKLLTIVISYLKSNPIEPAKRGLILGVLAKLKDSLSPRQKILMASTLKLLSVEDTRHRASLGMACSKIDLTESISGMLTDLETLVALGGAFRGDKVYNTYMKIFDLLGSFPSTRRVRLTLLSWIAHSGKEKGMEFVLNYLENKDGATGIAVLKDLPPQDVTDLNFLKNRFKDDRRLSVIFLQNLFLIFSKIEDVKDQDWLRILMNISQGKYGEVHEALKSRTEFFLSKNGGLVGLNNVMIRIRKRHFILNQGDIDLLFSYVENVDDSKKDSLEELKDLLYGCMKEENDDFYADLGCLLFLMGESYGETMIVKGLDSTEPSVVTKAIEYARRIKINSCWVKILHCIAIDSFLVHQKLATYFEEDESTIEKKALLSELRFIRTGERDEYEASQDQALSDDEQDELNSLFGKMRSSGLSNKAKFQFEQNMKELTIFFIDIAGYTKKSNTLDISEIMLMLDDFSNLIVPIGEKFNGTLIKKIGDCFMYTFENRLEAVLMSLEVQAELKDYNEHHVERDRVNTRIGLNTGKVFLKENDVYGDPVNVASRVESKAPMNSLLINATTLEGIEDFIEYEKMEPIMVKGIDDPLQTFHVLGSKPGVVQTYLDQKSLELEE
ncbi:MAG: adenylate/guanylate cyclase domain-containing protein [Candidatus Cloacimonetes bacterium]|nr:adenylate/guanylate cyclase domain-containing protein [Candidatus Cloacimonadota bacterium]